MTDVHSASAATVALAPVVLFDIDGTLLTGPASGTSAGVLAMAQAAQAITGQVDLHKRVEFAGRTDGQIARDLLIASGLAAPEPLLIEQLLEAYLQGLERNVISRPYRALGQVPEAVQALREAGSIVGLGTGNLRRGARAKLQSAGLLEHFDLDLGGYGDDAEARDLVLRAGAQRCDPSGTRAIIVVGDTPHDVRAAQAIGARCIGVPTGLYDELSLRAIGADAVIESVQSSIVAVLQELSLIDAA